MSEILRRVGDAVFWGTNFRFSPHVQRAIRGRRQFVIPASDEAKDILNGYKALQEELRTDGCKLADVLSVAIGLVKDDVRLMRDADIKLREQIAAMDNELYDLQEEVHILNYKLEKSMEENAVVKKRLDEVEQANAGLRTDNAGLRTENAAVKKRLDEVEQANAGLRTENAELRTENAHIKQRLEKIEQALKFRL